MELGTCNKDRKINKFKGLQALEGKNSVLKVYEVKIFEYLPFFS